MKINIVIGKNSNLSKKLKIYLDEAYLLPTLSAIEELNNIDFSKYSCINIIFNQFQKSTELNNTDSPMEYMNRSINSTAAILEYIKSRDLKINKIIYTSSSSVYGNNTLCDEDDELHPMNLHAALKVSNEKLIELFSKNNSIDYTVARIFNMYGGDDSFSIISKIISSYKNNKELTLINNGDAIRDFIHIDDVVKIYTKLLGVKNVPVLNIGTGKGKSVLYLIDYLRKNNILIKTKSIFREELKVSTCNNKNLTSIFKEIKFKNVEDYLVNEILNHDVTKRKV